MSSTINIEELKQNKDEILRKLKDIKNDIYNEKFKIYRAEYNKINNKLRYYTDEDYRRSKIDYVLRSRKNNIALVV